MSRQGCLNARLEGRTLNRVCRFETTETESLLGQGVSRFRLSARAVTRVLRVARTLADLEGREGISKANVAEAIQFRLMDGSSS